MELALVENLQREDLNPLENRFIRRSWIASGLRRSSWRKG